MDHPPAVAYTRPSGNTGNGILVQVHAERLPIYIRRLMSRHRAG